MDQPDAETATASEIPGPRELTKGQRRVLGTLVEKAITTPDQYPLTIKALTSGCNQKSNRDPVTTYTEETVETYLDELRELGLVACVHTESGRTERFRHYTRKRYPFTETQLAIMTELWLRGAQQPGELRTRAGRMAPINSQEELRADLTGLMQQGFVRADGPLDRRGVLVDHNFYTGAESQRLQARGPTATMERPANQSASRADAEPAHGLRDEQLSALTEAVEALRGEHGELAAGLEGLQQQLAALRDELADLRRSLGA